MEAKLATRPMTIQQIVELTDLSLNFRKQTLHTHENARYLF